MFQWLRSDEANRIADKARAKAWKDFKERCSNADLRKFSAQVWFDDKRQATSEVYLNRSDRVQTSVSGSDRRYWDDDTKKPLGIGGFPPELTLSLRSGPEGANRIGTEVPAVPFKENAASTRRLRSLSHHITTSMQNSEQYSQGRKFSALQEQNQSDGS